jgi:16S rRNA processing protein RimM
MDKNQCFELGYIGKVHGLDGSVMAVLDVDYPEQYRKMDALFVEQKGQLVPFMIRKISGIKGNQILLLFEGIESEAQAQELKGCKLFLPEKALPKLKDNQYYFHELVGCVVMDENQGELGEIREIVDLPHQTLAVMVWKGAEVLIPVHESIVVRINRTEKKVNTRLPEGLIDVFTKPDEKEEVYAD